MNIQNANAVTAIHGLEQLMIVMTGNRTLLIAVWMVIYQDNVLKRIKIMMR